MAETGKAPAPFACSIARTLEVVGEKWSLLAVREMFSGNHRFTAMVQNTGAPRDILTVRLRKLEEAGLVERRRYNDRPQRFEYHLTDLGITLGPVISAIRQWGDDHLAGPDGPPVTFLHSCGEELQTALVCAHCGGDPAESVLHHVNDRP